MRVVNWFVGGAVLLVGGVFLFGALARGSKAECGVDWVLAVCGSDVTFESWLQGELDESQRAFEEEYGDKFKPAFEIGGPMEFDAQAWQGFGPGMGNPEWGGR
jgi:hypothetical protein